MVCIRFGQFRKFCQFCRECVLILGLRALRGSDALCSKEFAEDGKTNFLAYAFVCRDL